MTSQATWEQMAVTGNILETCWECNVTWIHYWDWRKGKTWKEVYWERTGNMTTKQATEGIRRRRRWTPPIHVPFPLPSTPLLTLASPTPHSTILSPLSFSLLFASHFFPFFLWELLLLPFWYIWYLSRFYSFTTFLTAFYLTSSSHCFLPLFSHFSHKFSPPLSHHFLSFSLSSFYPSWFFSTSDSHKSFICNFFATGLTNSLASNQKLFPLSLIQNKLFPSHPFSLPLAVTKLVNLTASDPYPNELNQTKIR